MKSRPELAKEPRMMQFVVERPCPNVGGKCDETKLPVVIWVELGSKFASSEFDCGVRQYRVTFEQADEVRQKHGLKSKAAAYRVCEHMGHLVE